MNMDYSLLVVKLKSLTAEYWKAMQDGDLDEAKMVAVKVHLCAADLCLRTIHMEHL